MKKYTTKKKVIMKTIILLAIGTPALAFALTQGNDAQDGMAVAGENTAAIEAQDTDRVTAVPIAGFASVNNGPTGVVEKIPLNKTLDEFLAE